MESKLKHDCRPTFHAPVVDGGVGGQGNGVDGDPLPELDVFGHRMSLHLALHLNVEDLQRLTRCRQTHMSSALSNRNVKRTCTAIYRIGMK